MAIESCCIPLPSEIIMPFSGYLVFTGRFSLFGVGLAGALGCLFGSWVAYGFGYWGSERVVRRFIRRWGKYVFISEHELDIAERLFKKHGSAITFFSRLLPAIRTYISLPAGFAKMNFIKFSIYTFVGSFIWSYALGLVGQKMGENWNTLGPWFHKVDFLIVGIFVIGIVWYIRRHLKTTKPK
jgi:membrane protein DedA with SNARE-associated domain